MTAMDGGNAVFAGAKNCPCHRVIAYTDVGTWNLSGTKFRPFILNIAALCHPWHRVIPSILYIAALCHPWHRVIPSILGHKKPGYALAHRVLIFHFSKNTN